MDHFSDPGPVALFYQGELWKKAQYEKSFIVRLKGLGTVAGCVGRQMGYARHLAAMNDTKGYPTNS